MEQSAERECERCRVSKELRRQGVGPAVADAFGDLWVMAECRPDYIMVKPWVLAQPYGCDARTARDWLDALEENGLIHIPERPKKGRKAPWPVYVYHPRIGAAETDPRPDPQRSLFENQVTDQTRGLQRANPPVTDQTGGLQRANPPVTDQTGGLQRANPPITPGEPTQRTPERASLFSLSLSLDVDDDSEGDCEEEQTQRAYEVLHKLQDRLGKPNPNGQDLDDLCVAAVIATGKLSMEWLGLAVNQTAEAVKRRRHSNPIRNSVEYFKGCLRNGLCETLGLCGKDDTFELYGKLWRWAQPKVNALKHYVHKQKEPNDSTATL